MTNDEGRVVEGIFSPDRLSWKPGVPLGYGRTYTLAVIAVGDQGVRSEKASTFSTVTPGNQTKPTFVTSGGSLLADGGTFGIGIVIVTHFDEPITDRVAAEKVLRVETTPPVTGSWYWADDQNVHWRPEKSVDRDILIRVETDGSDILESTPSRGESIVVSALVVPSGPVRGTTSRRGE